MTSDHYFGTSLDIRSETLSPNEIGARLEATATRFASKGEQRWSKGERLIVSRTNFWSVAFEQATLEQQISALFEFIRAHAIAIDSIRSSGAQLEIYLFISPIGSLSFLLNVHELALLAKHGITFGLETHCECASVSRE